MADPAPTLVLASASPRRRELLGRLGLPFDVRPVDLDETRARGEGPDALVRRLALAKAQAALDRAPEPDVVVIGSDTIVTIDLDVLGKPADDAEAARTLRRLSGRTHRVLTGVAVARRTAGGAAQARTLARTGPATQLHVAVVSTEVVFGDLSAADIAWYVATGEPADKAGAYGIQGRAARFVTSITGSPDNVVGLPLAETVRLLRLVGVDPTAPGPPAHPDHPRDLRV